MLSSPDDSRYIGPPIEVGPTPELQAIETLAKAGNIQRQAIEVLRRISATKEQLKLVLLFLEEGKRKKPLGIEEYQVLTDWVRMLIEGGSWSTIAFQEPQSRHNRPYDPDYKFTYTGQSEGIRPAGPRF